MAWPYTVRLIRMHVLSSPYASYHQEPRIIAVQADLADWAATRKVVEGLGPVHLLVNNAAAAAPKPFLETTQQDMEL